MAYMHTIPPRLRRKAYLIAAHTADPIDPRTAARWLMGLPIHGAALLCRIETAAEQLGIRPGSDAV